MLAAAVGGLLLRRIPLDRGLTLTVVSYHAPPGVNWQEKKPEQAVCLTSHPAKVHLRGALRFLLARQQAAMLLMGAWVVEVLHLSYTQGMVAVDWQYRASYIRTRSRRRVGEIDIEPSWADEAVADPDAAWLDPDPKSKSGKSVRVIGHSPSAGVVITVILVPKDESSWWGANAWQANRADERIYREGQS